MEETPIFDKPGHNDAAWARALNRAILETSLDCIIAIDERGSVVEFNPAAQRVFGFNREQAMGKELAELIIPPALRERHRQGLRHYLKTGEGPVLGKRIEVTALRADGSEIAVELAITPFEVGGAKLFTAYLRDITDRVRGLEAIRRLAAIVESSEDAIISKNLKGVIVSWNEAAENLFGYTAEEAIGKPVTMLIPESRHDEEPNILGRIVRGEPIEHYETVRQHKSGRLLNVSLTVSPIRDEAGNVTGASKIARDITERVRAERRRTTQYTVANLLAGSWSLSDAGPQIIETVASSGNWQFGAIWLYDESEGVLHCHETWHSGESRLEAFAKGSRELTLEKNVGLPGRVAQTRSAISLRDVSHDPHFPRAGAALAANLRGAFAFPLYAEGTLYGVLELFSSDAVEPDNDLLQLVQALGSQIGLFIHRRRIEGELQAQRDAAEAANAAKDRFLATLSHELRTPLTPVLMWAGGTAGQPGLPPDIEEGLQMICRNVELEARLIDDLLDLTRIARGKLQLQVRRADAHELIRHALDIIRNDPETRRLTLDLKLDARHHFVNADAARLQQVFWNVLRNAYKFTPEHGAVSVHTFNPDSKTLAIEVRDTGVGIEPENLERIFDAFEQLGTRREGLGLGLAISKAVVEMHRGKIRALSDGPQKGASFVIELAATNGKLAA